MRFIDSDFDSLCEYIRGYGLAAVLSDTDCVGAIRLAHRDYLPFLQFWAICADRIDKNNFSIFGVPIDGSMQECVHLRETVSDIGSGLFCCLHGAYKPAHMALRSSIENFLRFISGPFEKDAMTTTSIYDLFDLSKKTEPFQGARKRHLEKLRSTYVELCKYSHSASLAHMAGIQALDHFPTFNVKAASAWKCLSNACMVAMVGVVISGCPPIYLEAHFAAKEMLDQLLPAADRLSILKGRPA